MAIFSPNLPESLSKAVSCSWSRSAPPFPDPPGHGRRISDGPARGSAFLDRLQIFHEQLDTAVAVGAFFRHHDFDHFGNPDAQGAVNMIRRHEDFFQVLMHHRRRGRGFKRNLAGDHMVEGGPKRVNIRPEIDIQFPANLFREI